MVPPGQTSSQQPYGPTLGPSGLLDFTFGRSSRVTYIDDHHVNDIVNLHVQHHVSHIVTQSVTNMKATYM